MEKSRCISTSLQELM